MENNTPYIQKAVLIDDRRIELYWNTQVRRADCEKNFLVKYAGEKRELFHWTSNMEWSYGTLYQKACAQLCHFPNRWMSVAHQS